MAFKDACVASALGLVVPGTGHIYLGRARRAVVPIAGFATILMTFGALGLISTIAGFLTIEFLIAGVMLFAVVDAAVLGFRSGRAAPKWYMRWFVVGAWMLGLGASIWLWSNVRGVALGYEVYGIPGVYMRPTIAPGDLLLVDTRVPITGELAPDTLVAFHHPQNNRIYVLRIRERIGPDTYSLTTGLPFAGTLQEIPRANIAGLVTAVVWSPERKEFPHALR